ncbi:hypothetical protein PDESU_02165 [Pontiella desulfatans]|uniref:Alpha-L-rhamnosidase six-hairpin glycosidase domain-containing protein n=1 Tax=Pontiella desulfatans TaxID=2750659 RepID=A0A6C2U0W3_PONDE|nr:alpha-L-rhamnosidase C-terminal domain-containing protein [Pontiella desulfatans]VGO13608.1 hypothetical protein PDESU_02165 [Pontiella desulfatans]
MIDKRWIGAAFAGSVLMVSGADSWQASWIGVDGTGIEITPNPEAVKEGVPDKKRKKKMPKPSGYWTCFRKGIKLDKAPDHAVAKIAVDSKYWLWINGEQVVFEGQLKRGPNPKDTYYDTVDLSAHLKKGDNTIALLVWYFGKSGFSHNDSGKAGLIFDASIDDKPLLSDASWKTIIHPAYGFTGAPHPNIRLPESNIRFDAQKDMLDWQMPGFDDSQWLAATEYGTVPCDPWNNLILRPIPLWKDFGLKDYVNVDELPSVSTGEPIIAKLPYNAQITPYLKVEGPAGQLIDLRMDNYRGGGPPNVRAEYVTRAGVQEYESLGWMNGHEMHYTIPAGFKILALKYRETGYDTEFTGTFECDDEFFNRYRQKALRTLYVTMRDTYFDCPDRERAQWWGDAVNELGEAFYVLDPRSSDLAQKGILELMNWQKDDGTIFSPVPGNYTRELPMQMLNSVGYFGFWTYYLYSGDLETIRTVYPGVKRYLEVWQIGDDGLVIPRKGGWTWGDWGKDKDMTILYNGWFYLALKGQKLMAEAVGETADIPVITARMKSIEANFNKTFWTGKEYRSPGYKGSTDDRAHALAVISGLAQPEQYPAILEVFRTEEHCSPYMEKYVGEALYQMRFEEDAIARAKKRYNYMTAHEYTTLFEGWEIGRKGFGGGTINHAWSGGMLTLLSQYGAGVAPVTPGYETYQVLPQMGSLQFIKTIVPSVKGDIKLELHNQTDAFSINLVSPEHTEAMVGLPKPSGGSVKHITANGETVWEDGQATQLPNGLRFVEETEHYIKFSARPGDWKFSTFY